jgi:hypothetical protein
MTRTLSHRGRLLAIAVAAVGLLAASNGLAAGMRTSKPFSGAKVNGGTVTQTMQGGRIVLTLSDDFVDPKTPDVHWQVVDSKGNVYLLQKLAIKEDKVNKSITLPAYIKDVAKVQIWCAWAETLLGEAGFEMMASAPSEENWS